LIHETLLEEQHFPKSSLKT